MKFDERFYFQRNRDTSGAVIPLDDFDNCRMRGIEKYPVEKIGKIEDLNVEIDYNIFNDVSRGLDLDTIALRLILSQDRPGRFLTPDISYYMQFLFYDFDSAYILFLYNAKITEFYSFPTNSTGQRISITVVSDSTNEHPACKIIEGRGLSLV